MIDDRGLAIVDPFLGEALARGEAAMEYAMVEEHSYMKRILTRWEGKIAFLQDDCAYYFLDLQI